MPVINAAPPIPDTIEKYDEVTKSVKPMKEEGLNNDFTKKDEAALIPTDIATFKK